MKPEKSAKSPRLQKKRLSVHKFTSCDGCQLAFLNAGEALLQLSELVDITHFAEAGVIDLETPIDIAFVEGSISTPDEIERIQKIRKNSRFLITIGACATAGGIQALRNFADHEQWVSAIYTTPEHIHSLKTSTPISEHVKVDYELWGCPVNTQQVLTVIRSLLFQAKPRIKQESVCMECKRNGNVCVLVTKKCACMGPVTKSGCGALCPGIGRACYACYGPKDNANGLSLGNQFARNGLSHNAIAQQFLHINNHTPSFKNTAHYFNSFKGIKIVSQ